MTPPHVESGSTLGSYDQLFVTPRPLARNHSMSVSFTNLSPFILCRLEISLLAACNRFRPDSARLVRSKREQGKYALPSSSQCAARARIEVRSEEHTSELQS